MLSENELNEIEDRASRATPGPWTGDRNDGTIKYKMMGGLDGQIEVLVVDHKNGHSGFYCGDGAGYEECEANEEFVKHARQDIPALLQEVRRLNEIIADAGDMAAEIRRAQRAEDFANAENARLRALLKPAERACEVLSEYMRSGEFFDPETSRAVREWQALKGSTS